MKFRQITATLMTLFLLAFGQPALAATPDSSAVTGLAIDLGTQTMEPAMSLRILTEDGKIVYGETEELSPATADAIVERGMAVFASSWQEVQERCGVHPLIVRSLRVQGEDIIVSSKAAEQIRQAETQTHFLEAFQVAVITTETGGTTQPEVTKISPSAGSKTAPQSLKLHPMPAWVKFRQLPPEQRRSLMERFIKYHPRWAVYLTAMQQLTPQERRIVREFFPPPPKARMMAREERQRLRRQFHRQYPELARKLQAFLAENRPGRRP